MNCLSILRVPDDSFRGAVICGIYVHTRPWVVAATQPVWRQLKSPVTLTFPASWHLWDFSAGGNAALILYFSGSLSQTGDLALQSSYPAF